MENNFKNVVDAINYIESLRGKSRINRLEYLKDVLNDLDLFAHDYKIIHIAGTNGKGSTVKFCEGILSNHDLKVGIFISPYVVSFNERIEINNENINDNDLIKYINILKNYNDNLIKNNKETLLFFEMCFIIALMYFKDNLVDVAVIECGIGGKNDITNVIDSDIALLTNIGYDHQNMLGNTLEEIALNKVSILKEEKTLITVFNEDLNHIFINEAKNKNANLILINKNDYSIDNNILFYDNDYYELSLIGDYQANNAVLAIKACSLLYRLDNNKIKKALNNIYHPARMEKINDKPLIYLDGGHNISALSEVVKYLNNRYNNVLTLFSSLKDKDYNLMILELEKITDTFIFTTIDDLRKADPHLFKCSKEYMIIEDLSDSLNYILENECNRDLILIIGSLHFASKVIEYFKNKK